MLQVKEMQVDYYYRHSIFNKDYFSSNEKELNINNIIKKIGLLSKKYVTRDDQKLLIPLRNELVKIFEFVLFNAG